MLTNFRQPGYKDGWRRETLGDVVKLLLDPIVSDLPVTGVTCDGDYYTLQVIQYFESKMLDYVIRTSVLPNIAQIIADNDLEKLPDGQGYEHSPGLTIGTGKRSLPLRLVIVKRGQELTPLVLPRYSILTPQQALLVYEERFGIETAYREIYKYLPSTCSTSPNYRLAVYASTVWFFNLLLNYHEIVVIWSPNPTSWETSLTLTHARFATLLGQIMRICSQ